MRKIAATVVMVIGVAILVAAILALVGNRLSLLSYSEQTEGQWVAYSIHKWAFILGELPLGLAVFLLGYLLWPSRLVSGPLVRPLAAFGVTIALAGLGATGFIVHSTLQRQEPFFSALWLGIQGSSLMCGLAILAGMAVRKLVRGVASRAVEGDE